MDAARRGFERLLEKHLLAFADHGAEFYAGSGNDPARALHWRCINVANRPTLRAFEQAHAIAVARGRMQLPHPNCFTSAHEALGRHGGLPVLIVGDG